MQFGMYLCVPRLFADSKKLCSLRVGHNQLSSLPDEYDVLYLEELHFQQNEVVQLPADLLQKAYRYRPCTRLITLQIHTLYRRYYTTGIQFSTSIKGSFTTVESYE